MQQKIVALDKNSHIGQVEKTHFSSSASPSTLNQKDIQQMDFINTIT
jgi:hypothetical protein